LPGDGLMDSLSRMIIAFKVAGQLLFLFGLFGWAYGVAVQLLHPQWLSTGLSNLTPWIRVDTFAVLSFVASALGFLIWRLAAELPQDQKATQN